MSQTDREQILYAYAIEPQHDRSTLERYVREHPALAADLIDVSSEIHLGEMLEGLPAGAVTDPGGDAAWEELRKAHPREDGPG